mgnify:CR=1 FL=1
MSDERLKILFDTDIGSDIDDAVALAYLLCQPRCELLGITTCTGQPVRRAELASAVCRHVGRDDVPIHPGCGDGLMVPVRQTAAAQAKALGNWPRRDDFEPNSAVEFLRRTVRQHPGEITLLAVGPMTNVALLFATDPQIAGLLKQAVVMCGRFFSHMGGEWNAINDPHATAVLYGAGPHARPPKHVSFGLDVTCQCTMEADACRRRMTAKVLEPVRDFAEVWFTRQQRPRITFHDPLAAACIFQPELCSYRQRPVLVPTEGPTAGWTVFHGQGENKPHHVAETVDAEGFFKHYFEIVK